jgi:hypothetical protein
MKSDEMGRRIDVRTLSGRFGEGPQVSGDRTLAIGPGNVNDGRELLFRMPKLREEPFDTSERQVDQLRMQKHHVGQ